MEVQLFGDNNEDDHRWPHPPGVLNMLVLKGDKSLTSWLTLRVDHRFKHVELI